MKDNETQPCLHGDAADRQDSGSPCRGSGSMESGWGSNRFLPYVAPPDPSVGEHLHSDWLVAWLRKVPGSALSVRGHGGVTIFHYSSSLQTHIIYVYIYILLNCIIHSVWLTNCWLTVWLVGNGGWESRYLGDGLLISPSLTNWHLERDGREAK